MTNWTHTAKRLLAHLVIPGTDQEATLARYLQSAYEQGYANACRKAAEEIEKIRDDLRQRTTRDQQAEKAMLESLSQKITLSPDEDQELKL